MDKRRIGRTDLLVSRICLGTMTWGQQNTEAEGQAQMDLAFECGVNFLDTAEMYPIPPMRETQGRTETYIGNWMQARKNRADVILATKVVGRTANDWFRDGRPSKLVRADIMDAIDKSLARLRTDYIDLYQIHFPERRVPWGSSPTRVGTWPPERDADETPIAETLAVFEELVKTGKIRHFGLSNESSWGVMRYVAESDKGVGPRPVSLQNAYNFVNRTFEVNLAEGLCARGGQPAALFAARPGLSDRQIRSWRSPGGIAHATLQARPALRAAKCRGNAARIQRACALLWPGARALRQRLRRQSAIRHLLDHRRDVDRAAGACLVVGRCGLDKRDAGRRRRRAPAQRQSLSLSKGDPVHPLSRRSFARLTALGLIGIVAGTARGQGNDMGMALIDAVNAGDADRVRDLIAAGAPLEFRDRARRTPLLLATRADHVEIARLLIEAGADVNAKDNIRDTPFLYAGAEGRDAILELILDAGADLKDTNRYGGNALIPAPHHGHPATVRILLAAGLDVDHVNNLGWTALIEAVILGDGGPVYQEIVGLLVDGGADVSIADRDGVTPLEHARRMGFVEIAERIAGGKRG